MLRSRPTSTRALVLLAGAVAVVPMVAAPAAASVPRTASVSVTQSGFTPARVTVGYGGKVTWHFQQGTHSVTDSSPLHLFDSGARPAGSTYSRTFINSGTFAYRSTVGTGIAGKVAVPVTAKPATGTRTTLFAVRWGSDYTPTGYNEQVQMKEPGARSWTVFVYGTPASNATFRAADWGNRTGTYRLRAKLYKGSNPAASSGWSPVAAVTVH